MDSGSDGADVLGFLTLPARADIELDALAVLERLVPVALDLRVVDEDVLALVTGDEPVTLLGVEELHSACSHASFLLCFVLLSFGDVSRSPPAVAPPLMRPRSARVDVPDCALDPGAGRPSKTQKKQNDRLRLGP
jgi:hypothetical protein